MSAGLVFESHHYNYLQRLDKQNQKFPSSDQRLVLIFEDKILDWLLKLPTWNVFVWVYLTDCGSDAF